MDVWGATGIRDGADCPETVAAVVRGDGCPEALEVRIRRTASVSGMMVASLGVALPDLDARACEWPSVAIKDTPEEMRDDTHGTRVPARDLNQVVVVVERQLGRIEWAFSLTRRREQRRFRGQAAVAVADGCLYSLSRGKTSLANSVRFSTVSACDMEPAWPIIRRFPMPPQYSQKSMI